MFDLIDDSTVEAYTEFDSHLVDAPHRDIPDLAVVPDAVEALDGLYRSARTFPCSGKTEIFFAPPRERRIRREKREALARSYCNQCVAKEMCKLAGRIGREHGIWGGENDEQRAAAGFEPRFPHRKAIRAAAKQADPLSA